jgi:hypothetical protein
MALIGVFADSGGDLQLFDAALQFLSKKGARRFLFAGGKYEDLDEWVKWKREEARAATDYGNDDFLDDISNWLVGLDQVERPPAFGQSYDIARRAEELARLKDRMVRTPEKGSLQYKDPSIPRKAMDMLGDTLCCLVHDKNDLGKEDMVNAVVLVHGNAAEPALVHIGPRFFVTPGRLKGSAEPTVGLLEQGDKGIKFSCFTLAGKTVIDAQPLALGGKTKISVK